MGSPALTAERDDSFEAVFGKRRGSGAENPDDPRDAPAPGPFSDVLGAVGALSDDRLARLALLPDIDSVYGEAMRAHVHEAGAGDDAEQLMGLLYELLRDSPHLAALIAKLQDLATAWAGRDVLLNTSREPLLTAWRAVGLKLR